MLTHVDRFLQFLEAEQDRSANTTAAYRNDLTQFTKFVKEQPGGACTEPAIGSWQLVGPEIVQGYVAHLRLCGYASATVARKVASIKSFFHWMQERGDLARNPADGLEAPKVRKVTPRPIRPEEIEQLLAEPGRERTPQALRDKALLETLYAAGMRVTELVALDLDDVDLEQGLIHCGGPGKKRRTMALGCPPAARVAVPARSPSSAHQALAQYLAAGRPHLQVSPGEQALFLNHRGQRLTRQGLWLIIKRYVHQVGIQAPVTPHTLRQSFAAHQFNAGVELQQVQQILGHASAQTTQAYRRAADDLAAAEGPRIIIDGRPYVAG